jgi:hypothetical protein
LRVEKRVSDFVDAIEKAGWSQVGEEILPQLLFHVLVFEKYESARKSHLFDVTRDFGAKPQPWGLGPNADHWESLHKAWYQPYRHDIIGDTLSADLLDYLHRDARRLNIQRSVDPKLLDSIILAKVDDHFYRCAIDLEDRKRGTHRTERLNDVFRLLDFRYEIHEKAVFHRVVQSAIAMVSRATLLLAEADKPKLEQLFGLDGILSPAICGEDHFLQLLVEATQRSHNRTTDGAVSHGIPQKLAERRVYRPLVVVPGDRVPLLLQFSSKSHTEPQLREVGAIIDSEFYKPYFSYLSWCIEDLLDHTFGLVETLKLHITDKVVGDRRLLEQSWKSRPSKRVIFWCLPYKQLYKDPGIWVSVNTKEGKVTDSIEGLLGRHDLGESFRDRIDKGIQDAQAKYAAMWCIYVFLSDGLFYSGAVAKLLGDPCALDGGEASHVQHLLEAQNLALQGIRVAWEYWQSRDKDLDLESSMSQDEFGDLIRLLAVQIRISARTSQKVREQISAVKVDQYVHGIFSEKCRDIRYKYDGHMDEMMLAKMLTDSRVSANLQQLIKELFAASKYELDKFGVEEVREIVQRFTSMPDLFEECFERKAARGPALKSAEVRHLWRESDFAKGGRIR